MQFFSKLVFFVHCSQIKPLFLNKPLVVAVNKTIYTYICIVYIHINTFVFI